VRASTPALRPMTADTRRGLLAAAAGLLLAGCAHAPPTAPLEPGATLAGFNARTLEGLSGALPAASDGWDRSQWLRAALQLNPQLAEQRAAVLAAAAAERSAAERPNPGMELFGEYLTTAAQSSAWLYGLSLDFLLRRPAERARARQQAALQTALAQSELAESIWQVRAALRQALLDAVSGRDETALLQSLVADREALVASDRVRVRLGDLARPQMLADELELARARQRQQQSQARAEDGLVRLAAAVGVPSTALAAASVRWDDWAAIGALQSATSERWRTEALIARPQITRALREYDLSQIGLQREVARRWPQLRVTPAYAWGGDGVREDVRGAINTESAVGVSFELPLFNQHQGPIAEAAARRAVAGEHLKAVQAQIFEQIDRAERAWPPVLQAWQETQQLATLTERHSQAEERALRAGASDRTSVLASQIATTEARLSLLAAAYTAEVAYGALEDAYHRPLQGDEGP
jgi:outer membrane protein, heavy metal efflux system